MIRSGSLGAINGPAGTMKRIIKNRFFFLERGYDISIYTHDSIKNGKVNYVPPSANAMKPRPWYKRILTDISAVVRRWARTNTLFANFYLKRSDRDMLKLIKYYISLNRKPDIIVFHSSMEAGLYLQLCSKPARMVTFLHSDGTHTMTLSNFPCIKGKWGEHHLEELHNLAINQTDKIVFISRIARDKFISNNPDYPKVKIGLAVNGIEDFTDEEKENVSKVVSRFADFKYKLCCSGTVNGRKGQWMVINAIAALNDTKRKNFHFSILGDGSQRTELQQMVKDKHLEKNVSFEGKVKNELIYKYLAENNIYILMSENEGLPISIVEAMRSSLAVISTNVAGIPETVDKNGLLLDVSQQQLEKVFVHMDEYNWEEMGRLSREKFEKEFSFNRMRTDYCDIMDSLFK